METTVTLMNTITEMARCVLCSECACDLLIRDTTNELRLSMTHHLSSGAHSELCYAVGFVGSLGESTTR